MKALLIFSFLFLSVICYAQSDSNKYAEMTTGGTLDRTEKFKLYINDFTETAAPKLLPYTYPIDALNYLAKQGWRCYSIFSVTDEAGYTIRHYELERK